MSDVKNWSQSATNNDDGVPDGAPEGMVRSQVNNVVREVMASVRRLLQDPEWRNLNLERTKVYAVSKVDATNVRITSGAVNVSSSYPAGSRVRITDGSSPVEAFVESTAYTASTHTDVTISGAVVPDGTNSIEVSWVQSLGRAAWSDTGTTTGQTPEQVVTIDQVDDAAFVTKLNLATGLDADTVDSKHAVGTALHGSATDLVDLAGADNHNLLLNSTFSVWQRGSTIDSTGVYNNDNGNYGPDCWKILSGNTGAKVNDVVDLNKLDNYRPSVGGHWYTCQILGATVAATAERAGIFQVLESSQCARIQGQTCSLSFYAATSAGAGISGMKSIIFTWTGTADQWTADPIAATGWNAVGADPTPVANWVISGSESHTPTATFTKFSHDGVDIPFATHNVGVLIFIDDDSWVNGESLFINGPQLEWGAVSTAHKFPDTATDMMQCQRFFRSTFETGVSPAQNIASTNGAFIASGDNGTAKGGTWYGPVPMLQTPTVTTYNPNASNAFFDGISGADSTNITTIPGKSGVGVHTTDGGDLVAVHITVDASR